MPEITAVAREENLRWGSYKSSRKNEMK